MIQITISAGNSGRWRRAALLALAGVLAIWLAYIVREIWLPLLVAFVIAMVLDPLVDKMESRGWSRLAGALLIYVLFFAVVAGVLILAVPAVVQQTTVITNQIGKYLPTPGTPGNDAVMKKHLDLLMNKVHATAFVRSAVERASSQISSALNSAAVWLGRVTQAALSNLLWVIIIPLVSFYALKDLHLIYARLLLLVPRDQRVNAQNFLNEVTAIFVRYLRGLMIVCAANGVATMIVLTLFHVPDALGLGAISGVLYTVPYLGPVLTYAIVGGVAIIAGKSVFIILAILIVLHSVVFDQIITPRVLGGHVGLHPILAIMALLIGGSLLGILGMILSVPVAAVVQMVVIALIPKLNAQIEVPTGEQLHSHVDESTAVRDSNSKDELTQTPDIHQTIVAAVDTAEEQEEEAEKNGTAPAPFTGQNSAAPSAPAAGKK